MYKKVKAVVDLGALFIGFDEVSDKYVLNRTMSQRLISYVVDGKELEVIMPVSTMTRMQKEAVEQYVENEGMKLTFVTDTMEELLTSDSKEYKDNECLLVYLVSDEELASKYKDRYEDRLTYSNYKRLF